MINLRCDSIVKYSLIIVTLLASGTALAANTGSAMTLPGFEIGFTDEGKLSSAVQIILLLTVLSLAPAILIVMTSFTRIIIVLSMLRHAFGMQQTPPNTVLISLALFLTFFTMSPVLSDIYKKSYQPLADNTISISEAAKNAMGPLRVFMVKHTREADLALLVDISGGEPPKTIDDITYPQLLPAFMLSELKTAFQIGFIIFLPFLLIDIVVASILMSMGMLMVPPMMISLPIKVLMFVLIDGWNLVVGSLVKSIV